MIVLRGRLLASVNRFWSMYHHHSMSQQCLLTLLGRKEWSIEKVVVLVGVGAFHAQHHFS